MPECPHPQEHHKQFRNDIEEGVECDICGDVLDAWPREDDASSGADKTSAERTATAANPAKPTSPAGPPMPPGQRR